MPFVIELLAILSAGYLVKLSKYIVCLGIIADNSLKKGSTAKFRLIYFLYLSSQHSLYDYIYVHNFIGAPVATRQIVACPAGARYK